MITRRNCFIGAAALWASKAAAPWVSAPNVVCAVNLMAIRGALMTPERNYYGYCDRLWINQRYRSGELRRAISIATDRPRHAAPYPVGLSRLRSCEVGHG